MTVTFRYNSPCVCCQRRVFVPCWNTFFPANLYVRAYDYRWGPAWGPGCPDCPGSDCSAFFNSARQMNFAGYSTGLDGMQAPAWKCVDRTGPPPDPPGSDPCGTPGSAGFDLTLSINSTMEPPFGSVDIALDWSAHCSGSSPPGGGLCCVSAAGGTWCECCCAPSGSSLGCFVNTAPFPIVDFELSSLDPLRIVLRNNTRTGASGDSNLCYRYAVISESPDPPAFWYCFYDPVDPSHTVCAQANPGGWSANGPPHLSEGECIASCAAPWYCWTNPANVTDQVCATTNPGGWNLTGGPYETCGECKGACPGYNGPCP